MTTAVELAQVASAGVSEAFKNRIINGAMVIDQRNAGASVAGNNVYTLDRYGNVASQNNKFTVQQNAGSVTPPVGFSKYLGVTSSSAYSVPSNEVFCNYQNIEGFNTADLQWGTANAKTVTLSFWVRSSLTGTFGGAVANNNFDRSYPYSYTISTANTWEFKSITITGDTSGTWVGATNGIGLRVYFAIGVGADFSGTAGAWVGSGLVSATGATSVVGTNGATFYITGVQLEVGSSATSFEYRPYGTELSLCHRYFEVFANPYGIAMSCYNTTDAYSNIAYTQKRASPGVSLGSVGSLYSAGAGRTVTSVSAQNVTSDSFQFKVTGSGFTGGYAGHYDFNGNLTISAEL